MTARRRFVADQLAAATVELDERTRASRARSLTARHRATALLANRLLAALANGLALCEHLQAGAPQRVGWSPGASALECFMCSVAGAALNDSDRCDVCDQPAPLAAAGLQLGPVLVQACLCAGCLRTGRRSDLNLDAARLQVTRYVVDRYEEIHR